MSKIKKLVKITRPNQYKVNELFTCMVCDNINEVNWYFMNKCNCGVRYVFNVTTEFNSVAELVYFYLGNAMYNVSQSTYFINGQKLTDKITIKNNNLFDKELFINIADNLHLI